MAACCSMLVRPITIDSSARPSCCTTVRQRLRAALNSALTALAPNLYTLAPSKTKRHSTAAGLRRQAQSPHAATASVDSLLLRSSFRHISDPCLNPTLSITADSRALDTSKEQSSRELVCQAFFSGQSSRVLGSQVFHFG